MAALAPGKAPQVLYMWRQGGPHSRILHFGEEYPCRESSYVSAVVYTVL
jgi:hypothetical protein